jgi:tRNA (adenine37-N6)-methyltransferase
MSRLRSRRKALIVTAERVTAERWINVLPANTCTQTVAKLFMGVPRAQTRCDTARMVLACPLPAIGVVHTARRTTETTPVQAALNRGEHGTIEIYSEYAEGLAGLDGFDYAWLVSWLHQPHATQDGAPPLTQVPFLLRAEQRRMGIFATRGPRRVNPIGLSLVKLASVTDREVEFGGVDLLDGTPVIDLKPYVSRFDRPDGEPRCGWFDSVALTEGLAPSDLGQPTDGA